MTDTPELIAAIEELLDQHSFKIAVEMELHAALRTTTKNKAKDIRLSLSDLACLISATQAAEIECLQARVAELEAQIEGLLKIVHSDHKAFCQTEEAATRPYKYR